MSFTEVGMQNRRWKINFEILLKFRKLRQGNEEQKPRSSYIGVVINKQ